MPKLSGNPEDERAKNAAWVAEQRRLASQPLRIRPMSPQARVVAATVLGLLLTCGAAGLGTIIYHMLT